AGVAGRAAFSPDGRVLAITKTRSLVQLVDARAGRELATLEPPEQNNVSALEFSPDGRLLVAALGAAGILVWDLGAIHGGLASLGLNWPLAEDAPPVARADVVPAQIVVDDAPWMGPLERGESLARAGRRDEAAAAFEEAVAKGAQHVDAQVYRVLF